jgi:hypothetical protein
MPADKIYSFFIPFSNYSQADSSFEFISYDGAPVISLKV